jgi:nucleotide-binding universal stress UspA family protein
MSIAFEDLTVPVDHSATSFRGVDAAIDLARDGTRLHFCSVVNAADVVYGGSMGTPIDPQPIIEALESDAEERCDEAIARAAKRGIRADGKVLFGAVVPAIRAYAVARHSNAIVIGTHGRTGVARVFFGSVAESLMQTSEFPVVVAHADDVVTNDGPIAVAIDGSPASRVALQAAIDLAHAQRRRLAIINVVEADHQHAEWNDAATLLSDAADIVRALDVAFDLTTAHGPVAETIVGAAQRLRCPLIVVGTRGHGGVARVLLGSVAAAVVEHAHVPVMVVRER